MARARRPDRVRASIRERVRLLVTTRARQGPVSCEPSVVEEPPAECDLGVGHRVVRRNDGDRKTAREMPGIGEDLGSRDLPLVWRAGARATREPQPARRHDGHGPAPGARAHCWRNYQVRWRPESAIDAVSLAVSLRSPTHFSKPATVAGSTPAASAWRFSTQDFIAVSRSAACSRSAPINSRYAFFASSTRFSPRYASPRYSVASGKPGAISSALS